MPPHHAPRNYDQSPMNVYWEMTQACALACRHCRAEAMPTPAPNERSTIEGKQLLQQITAFGDPLPATHPHRRRSAPASRSLRAHRLSPPPQHRRLHHPRRVPLLNRRQHPPRPARRKLPAFAAVRTTPGPKPLRRPLRRLRIPRPLRRLPRHRGPDCRRN